MRCQSEARQQAITKHQQTVSQQVSQGTTEGKRCLTGADGETGTCCKTWCFTADTSTVRTQYLPRATRCFVRQGQMFQMSTFQRLP